jgi:hypothetical protein
MAQPVSVGGPMPQQQQPGMTNQMQQMNYQTQMQQQQQVRVCACEQNFKRCESKTRIKQGFSKVSFEHRTFLAGDFPTHLPRDI